MNYGLHVIRYPTGRFGFVGNVPASLAYRGSAYDIRTAAICGAGIARKAAEREGRQFVSLSWDTEADAIAEATAQGFKLAGEG